MNPLTLEFLRQDVHMRLGDYDRKIKPSVIDWELNRQLDLWTRDNELLQQVLVQTITAATNPQLFVAPEGYQIARVLSIKINQSGQDNILLELRTPRQMDKQIPDWRDSDVSSSVPSLGVLDFFASTPGQKAVPRGVWLWPWPAETLTNGLVVNYVAATNRLLREDEDEVPVQASYAAEYLVEKTSSELAMRLKDFDLGQYHAANAKQEGRNVRRRAHGERTGDRSSVSYFV